MNYLENITQLIPTVEAMLHVNTSAESSEQPGVSPLDSKGLLGCLCSPGLSLRKALSNFPTKPALLSALTIGNLKLSNLAACLKQTQ